MVSGTNQARTAGMMRNVFHLGLGQVTTTALTIMLSAAVARTLGAADFGVLYVITAIATFTYVLVDWGHGPFIVREVARHPEQAGELIGSATAARAAMAALGCVLVIVAMWVLGYDARTRVLTVALIVAWFPQYVGLSFGWVFRGRERMDCDAALGIVLKLASLLFSLICLALGGRLLGLVLIAPIAGFITAALAILLYRRLHLPSIHATPQTVRTLVVDGAPMLAISLAVATQPVIDASILYKIAPRTVVGWYGASWNIAGTLVAPALILGATIYPRLSRAATDSVELKRTLRMSFRPLLLVALLNGVGTYLFADVAIGLIYGKAKFGAAAPTLRAFAPALVLLYVDMLFGHAILAVGKAGRLACAKVGAVVATTGLELVLIPWFQARFGNGGVGTMLSIGAGELVMVAAAMLLIRDAIDARMIVDLLRGLVAGGATLLLFRLLPTMPPFAAIPVCVLTFVALSAAVGLVNRSDLELLVSPLRRRTTPVAAAEATLIPTVTTPSDPLSGRTP